MRGLKDKRYVIGGGATGIGAALARRLVEEGARVIVGDINAAGLEALAASTNGALLTETADLSESEPVERLIARAASEFGGIDGLAITVADLSKNTMGRDCDLADFLPEVWERTMRVNVIGHALLIKAAIPHLRATGSGAIVTITSGAAYAGNAFMPAYGASKAALHAVVRSAANLLGRDFIRCNGIAPGFVQTDGAMVNVSPEWRDQIVASQPLPRPGMPEDIASVMAFLLSDESALITGQVIGVNAGTYPRD
jgi:NAD(P)-dependent dehydrogenase (short-subunit alcohol dehydrogenase family)